jgi:hypothetical protein
MQNPTRQQIFEQAAKKMRQDFAELTVIPHAGTKGSEGEAIVREFLNQHLPGRFRAGSGFIIDREDQVSKQTDVVVYDHLHCPIYRASDIAGIYPNDNVAAIVEVKSAIDKEKLFDAAEKIAHAKSLGKTKRPNVAGLINIVTLGTVFAFGSSITLETLEQHYVETLQKHGIGRHIDAIMVLDKGIISLAGKAAGTSWSPMMTDGGSGPEGSHVGTGISKYGLDSLDALFRLLLTHLVFFRQSVDHPGFKVGAGRQPLVVRYLTSVTREKNPRKRDEKLRRYKEEAAKELSNHPVPPDSETI